MSMSSTLPPSSTSAPAELTLKRSLKLRDLVIYGIVLIQPTAALPLIGVVSQEARGHVVTTLLVAMVAMLFTGPRLRWPAKVLGGAWLAAGLLWGGCRKGGFRTMRDVA